MALPVSHGRSLGIHTDGVPYDVDIYHRTTGQPHDSQGQARVSDSGDSGSDQRHGDDASDAKHASDAAGDEHAAVSDSADGAHDDVPAADSPDADTAHDDVPADTPPAMVGPNSPAAAVGEVGGEPAPRRREPVRTTIRTVGELLITAGVVVLLFVVYELWITNLIGAQKQAEATQALDKLWAQESDVVVEQGDAAVVTQSGGVVVSTAAGPTKAPPKRTRDYQTTEGAGFAKLYIPSFGPDFAFTVVEGTNQKDLYIGPGHYLKTQYPGQPGNFALAGHRVNKGAPFDDLGLLNSCDAIVMETRDSWYVYRVLPLKGEVANWAPDERAHCDGVEAQTGKYAGVYGREITVPSDIEQIFPIPHVDSRTVPTGAESLITLTTCHPKFSDRERMIVHGVLVGSYAKSDGFLPPAMQETS